MSALNAVLRGLFDLLLAPMRSLPPLVGVVVVSLVGAMGMLIVIKKTSNQKKIEEVKNKINASLFEIRLFSDDIALIMKAQFDILRYNLSYLRYSLVPTFYMLIPIFLVIAQLQFHYGYSPLAPGKSFIVKATLSAKSADKPDVTLELPAGLKSETPAAWSPSTKEVAWRVMAENPGNYEIKVNLAGQTFTKTAEVATGGVRRRSPERLEPTLWNQLIYPAESALPPGGPLTKISVSYAETDVPIGIMGLAVNWMILFFVLSIAFALALKGKFGVTM